MCNRTSYATTFGTAARALAIALLIIGTGVTSAWAGSDQTSGLNFTPISSEGVYRSGTKADEARRYTQALQGYHQECSLPPDNRFLCDSTFLCQPNPNVNGRYWCDICHRPDVNSPCLDAQGNPLPDALQPH